ncbi:MAG: hypothetical protein ACO3XO_01210 [Bdellovibrionota bacterium]
MTISMDRLDFLHRENQLRQEDIRRLRSSLERKIALLKRQFSQTKRRHENLKSTFLADRFSMAPKEFFEFFSAIRKNQHGEQASQNNLAVMTKHSHRLERQLAYYEKKQELVAKKQAEHRAVERAIREECESEQIQSIAFLLRRAIQAPNRLGCHPEEPEVGCVVALERSSAEEADEVTFCEKGSAEQNQRAEDATPSLSQSESVLQDETRRAHDTGSNSFSFYHEGSESNRISSLFQESMHQQRHDPCNPQQNDAFATNRNGKQRISSNESLQKAQHWEDRDGHHHLIFQVPLSRNESVRIAVERQRENHLSLVLIAVRGQRVSLEQVRNKLYSRLEGAGFVVDGLRIIREG